MRHKCTELQQLATVPLSSGTASHLLGRFRETRRWEKKRVVYDVILFGRVPAALFIDPIPCTSQYAPLCRWVACWHAIWSLRPSNCVTVYLKKSYKIWPCGQWIFLFLWDIWANHVRVMHLAVILMQSLHYIRMKQLTTLWCSNVEKQTCWT